MQVHSLRALSTAVILALACAATSCSEDKNPNPVGSGGNGGSSAGYTNNGEGACPKSVRPANDDFCQATCLHDPKSQCSLPNRPIDACCVMVGEPGRLESDPFLKRTTDTKDYADPAGKPPNLDCFEASGYPAKPPAGGADKKITLKGELQVFANGGCDANALIGVNVEVYKVNRTGDPTTDGTLGDLVASVTASDSMPIVLEDVTNCNDDPRPNREYELPDIPMYTELVVKTSGTGWTSLYAYNLYVTAEDPDFDAGTDTYTYDVRALAESDFQTIPTVAIGTTITAGNGAIGGELHDCDNVRLQNARVDISIPRTALVYFDDNEDDPLPSDSRTDVGTGRTALYTALDITVEGQSSFARVAGTGLVPDGDSGKKLVSLGYFDVRVFPNSVTSVSLRGLRPFQVP